jgi:integrase
MKLVKGKGAAFTLKDAFDAALLLHYKTRSSYATVEQHKAHVAAVLDMEAPVSTIGMAAYTRLVAAQEAKGHKPGTINRVTGTLHAVLKMTCLWGMWPGPVPAFPKQKEPTGRVRTFTPEEEDAIVEHFRAVDQDDMADLCIILADTGLRLGEAVKYDCIQIKGPVVEVWRTKTQKPRSVPLTPRAMEALKRHLKARSVHKDRAEYCWTTMRKALGHAGDAEFVMHVFRHTCATRLLSGGMDVRKVMVWMGHRDIETTLRYTRVGAEDLALGPAILTRARG